MKNRSNFNSSETHLSTDQLQPNVTQIFQMYILSPILCIINFCGRNNLNYGEKITFINYKTTLLCIIGP